ncbi:hypothetical protein OAC11_05950 [Alphaproteobacteria bacterium]|jgi:hypothetical protein|nr:hypothetical protein [Alphaproteobacteria bacterium]|tara:strand:+ start:119 stop:604 length:486 start_codon:yes stop_codon:yes gene_type:complete
MFFNIKKILLICSFFFIISCSLSNKNLPVNSNINLISIETPNDRDNILFNEYLKRAFKPINDVSHKFLLETSISYSITNALSISGLNSLNRTTAIVNYKLYSKETNKLIKSGSINSFTSIGSTSSSLYTNDINLKFVKERLNLNASIKLKNYLNIILRRLS